MIKTDLTTPGALTTTMKQNNSALTSPIDIYSIGVIRDVNLDNCLSFDGTQINIRKCPVVLTEFNDTHRFKFINGEVHDVKDNYCFVRNSNSEFSFEKINTYDSWTNNCYKFKNNTGFQIQSDGGNTCLANNLDKLMSIPCNASNWKMTMNVN
jgi:hypothetical protein